MPKFINLNIDGECQWRLVIDNVNDLEKYHQFNATQNMRAFMGMERDAHGNIALSHTGAAPTRQIGLQRLLHNSIMCAPEGTKVYPLIEVAKFTDQKYLSMLKFITNNGAIQMNEAGGYCGLNDFIKTWNAEVVAEIETPGFGFPTSDAAIEADTIILENSCRDYSGSYIVSDVKKDVKDCGTIETIYSLNEVDSRWLFRCISNCKNVVAATELQDDSQLNSFMTLFGQLKGKNIYLYVSKSVKSMIQKHPEFAKNKELHNIYFITK